MQGDYHIFMTSLPSILNTDGDHFERDVII